LHDIIFSRSTLWHATSAFGVCIFLVGFAKIYGMGLLIRGWASIGVNNWMGRSVSSLWWVDSLTAWLTDGLDVSREREIYISERVNGLDLRDFSHFSRAMHL